MRPASSDPPALAVSSHPPTLAAATTAAALLLAACGTDSTPARPNVEVETIGDTTVVRTLSGSVWGSPATLVPEVSVGEVEGAEEYLLGSVISIAVDSDWNLYVLDEQAHHVQVYDSAGNHLRTLGRRGEGPGELSRAEAIAVLPDGRLLVRDPGNMRVQVYGPGPQELDEWQYNPGNTYMMTPFYTDVRGRIFLSAKDLSQTDFAMHLIVLGSDGTHGDTIPEPTSDHQAPTVRAEHTGEDGSTASVQAPVPFAPQFLWTLHPNGRFLSGISAEYRIDLARDDGVLRIERAHTPVPVSTGERDYQRERTVRMVRFTVPDWRWSGPPIPQFKPVFRELSAGRGGRIWVRLWTEGHSIENEDHDPDDPFSETVSWHEATRYDVFEPDGTYLGVVDAPEEFRPWPPPVFDGDHVWAMATDELGVQRVVRYRIVVGGE